MGYFSNLAAEYAPADHDHSYIPPEKQLLWRLEELKDRYHELANRKTGKGDDGACFSDANLRLVLPEHFLSPCDVRKAIDLTTGELRDRYGIAVGDAPEQDAPVMDELTGLQLSFLDLLALQSQCLPLCVA